MGKILIWLAKTFTGVFFLELENLFKQQFVCSVIICG